MARILIVDDDQAFRSTLAETVMGLGHSAVESDSAEKGLRELARSHFDAVFLDFRMPGMNGIDALAVLRDRIPSAPPVIMLTAYASGANTIDAMKLGAFDHLSKPIGRDAIQEVLEKALRTPRTVTAATQTESADSAAGELIGVSQAMREVHKRVGLAADSQATVLILGETGTGKEMVARALHRHSARSEKPFLAVNCAAIPKELLESELFGHVRGAFTGALVDRPGCFRAADGGVLLLDEIGDMALSVQAKILRVLQEGEVTPVGSSHPVPVNVRLIAATHRDLHVAVKAGEFREDLWYRLNVLPIRIPPLRERLADIIPLAEYFLRIGSAGGTPKILSADAAQRLLQRAWLGNVRELKNVMDRSQALVRSPVIAASDLDEMLEDNHAEVLNIGLPDWFDGDLPTATARLEKTMIERAMAESKGNRTEAARRLGIHRQLLYSKLKQLGLE